MSTVTRFVVALSLCTASTIAAPLFAQTVSVLPRTESKNLSSAIPPYCPLPTKSGDGLSISGKLTKGYYVPDMPLTFVLSPKEREDIAHTYFVIDKSLVSDVEISSKTPLPAYSMPPKDTKDLRAKPARVISKRRTGGRQVMEIECLLYSYEPDVKLEYTATTTGERGVFQFKNREKLGDIFCFINDQCIGKMNGESTAECDLRHLPAGSYRLSAVAESKDGRFLPYKSFSFNIAPRYDLSFDGLKPEETMTVSIENPDEKKLVLRAKRQSGCTAKYAHVYVDSTYVDDIDQEVTQVVIPLKSVPTGKVRVEVIPVGEDNQEYPEEIITFNLVNLDWKQRVCSTEAFQITRRNINDILKAERDAAHWMARAEKEPAFYWSYTQRDEVYENMYGTRYTLPSLTMTPIPGKAGQYLAKAREAITLEAQLCLQNARLLRKLRINSEAKMYYKKSIYLYGKDNASAKIAQQELDEMLKPTRLVQDAKKP